MWELLSFASIAKAGAGLPHSKKAQMGVMIIN
jgi:hypothetical protein